MQSRKHVLVCLFCLFLLISSVFLTLETNILRNGVFAQPQGVPGIAVPGEAKTNEPAQPHGPPPTNAAGTSVSPQMKADLAQVLGAPSASFRVSESSGSVSPYFVDFTTIHDPRTNQSHRRITVVDLVKCHICVYAVDGEGKIKLQSSRNIEADLQFDFYNGVDPSPQQIENVLKRNRSN